MFDKVIRSGRRRPVFDPGESATRVEFGRAELERMLPHRDPMLLIDGIDAVDLEVGGVRGFRTVVADDPVFAGHFPGDPVYPGVLLLEMVGQLGICLQHLMSSKSAHIGPEDAPKALRLLKVHHAMFQGGVRPGERLTLVAKSIEDSDYVSTCVGQALCEGEVRALAVYEVFLLE